MSIVDHDARKAFMQEWCYMGTQWLADHMGLSRHTVIQSACMYRVSLKTDHEQRGRDLKATVKMTQPITQGEFSRLPITHPVIKGIFMARGKTGKKELLTRQWKDQRKRVLQRDSYECAYCGDKATQVDHIVARAKGGTHEMDNLVACCARCNGLKGSRSQSSFLARQAAPQ